MNYFKKHKIFSVFLLIFLILLLLFLNAGPKIKPVYGVTFSAMQAKDLGLDWKQAYSAVLEDLKVKYIRIPVYWNQVEAREDSYDFGDLDYQLDLAAKHGVKVILTIGRRVPRWPECFEPEWEKNLPSQTAKDNALLSYIASVVTRYHNTAAVAEWQVENEPFLSSFGICPKLDVNLLDREIAEVKKLDPSRPVLISDSGELSLWISSGKRGDIFGTTLYRYVFSDIFKRYWVNYIPFWFYRVKAGFFAFIAPRQADCYN